MRLDLDYLRLKVRTLEASAGRVLLTADDAALLRAACDILARISNPYRPRRSLAGVVPELPALAESTPAARRRGPQQHQGRKRA